MMEFDPVYGYGERRFEMEEGHRFENQPVSAVRDFLQSRKMDKVEAPANSFRIVMDGPRLVLEHVNGRVRQWPVRHCFFQKLLRWYHIPRKPLYRMEAEVVVPFLNGILKLINKDVSISIEDGAALSIFSPLYSEVRDLDILDQCRQPLEIVTRTDFFMRAYTEILEEREAVAGDLCGYGGNLLNSETGFMALQVVAYILRYVCDNGAAITLLQRDRRVIHYNTTPSQISGYLEGAFDALNNEMPGIFDLLQKACRKPLPDEKGVINRLNELINYPNGKNMYAGFRARGRDRLYDLFNFLTEKAKHFSPECRYKIEEYAGSLLAQG